MNSSHSANNTENIHTANDNCSCAFCSWLVTVIQSEVFLTQCFRISALETEGAPGLCQATYACQLTLWATLKYNQ